MHTYIHTHRADTAPDGRDARSGCICQCTGTCDCTRCERTTYSEVVRITAPKGILEPGMCVCVCVCVCVCSVSVSALTPISGGTQPALSLSCARCSSLRCVPCTAKLWMPVSVCVCVCV